MRAGGSDRRKPAEAVDPGGRPSLVDGAERAKVESAVSDLRTALKGEDKGQIDKKAEALAQASASIAQRAYAAEQGGAAGGEAPAGAGGASAGPQGGPSGENVVDAEFEEVKDKGRKAS